MLSLPTPAMSARMCRCPPPPQLTDLTRCTCRRELCTEAASVFWPPNRTAKGTTSAASTTNASATIATMRSHAGSCGVGASGSAAAGACASCWYPREAISRAPRNSQCAAAMKALFTTVEAALTGAGSAKALQTALSAHRLQFLRCQRSDVVRYVRRGKGGCPRAWPGRSRLFCARARALRAVTHVSVVQGALDARGRGGLVRGAAGRGRCAAPGRCDGRAGSSLLSSAAARR